jgi:hypothetical protein
MPAQQQLDMLTVVAALNTGNARRTSLSNATKRGSSVGIMCIVVALAAAPSQPAAASAASARKHSARQTSRARALMRVIGSLNVIIASPSPSHAGGSLRAPLSADPCSAEPVLR